MAAVNWREKRRAGEDVTGQNKAKTRIGEYQRAWGSSVVLRVALATAFALGRGDSPTAVAHGSGQGMEKGRGEARPL